MAVGRRLLASDRVALLAGLAEKAPMKGVAIGGILAGRRTGPSFKGG